MLPLCLSSPFSDFSLFFSFLSVISVIRKRLMPLQFQHWPQKSFDTYYSGFMMFKSKVADDEKRFRENLALWQTACSRVSNWNSVPRSLNILLWEASRHSLAISGVHVSNVKSSTYRYSLDMIYYILFALRQKCGYRFLKLESGVQGNLGRHIPTGSTLPAVHLRVAETVLHLSGHDILRLVICLGEMSRMEGAKKMRKNRLAVL